MDVTSFELNKLHQLKQKVKETVPENSLPSWTSNINKIDNITDLKVSQPNRYQLLLLGKVLPQNIVLSVNKTAPKFIPSTVVPKRDFVGSTNCINQNHITSSTNSLITSCPTMSLNSKLLSVRPDQIGTNPTTSHIPNFKNSLLVQFLPSMLTNNSLQNNSGLNYFKSKNEQMGVNKPSTNTSTLITKHKTIQFNNATTSEGNVTINNSTKHNASHLPVKSATSKTLEIVREINCKSYCLVCHIDFTSDALLKNHKEGKGFVCRVCNAEFENHAVLETHFASHPTYKCKACGEILYSRTDLYQHKTKKISCKGNLECEVCHQKFLKKWKLKLHKISRHSEGNGSYKCPVCEKDFKIEPSLKLHMKSVHIVQEYLECTVCHKLCLGPDRLKYHTKSIHLVPEDKKTFFCSICGKIYNSKFGLKTHQETHDNTVILCEICGKSFEKKATLKTHMTKEHSKSGTFICKTCNQQFDMEIKLIIHKRHKHRKYTIPEPVYCEICGKKYKTSKILKHHLMTHYDDKPFKCNICDATFKQQVTLKTHQRVHSSVGKYFCDVCGLSFRWKGTFDRHVKNCIE